MGLWKNRVLPLAAATFDAKRPKEDALRKFRVRSPTSGSRRRSCTRVAFASGRREGLAGQGGGRVATV